MYQRFKFLIPIAVIIIIATIGYMQIYAHNPFMELGSLAMTLVGDSSMNRTAPEIQGIAEWINSEPLTLAQLQRQGNVVLVEFWTYACINCQRSLPHVVEWHEKYKDQGLVVIGVHTPEFKFERDSTNVRAEMAKYPITFPVALDNGYKTWRAWGNHFWPASYLVDVHGTIVYQRFGEGAYEVTESKIQELLEEAREYREANGLVL